jgi:predicted ATPase
MIEHINIRNFKSIRDINIELRQINLLIGQNGAGKSNFVEFFNFIKAISEGALIEYTLNKGGAGRLLFLGPRVSTFLAGFVYYKGNYRYGISVRRNEVDGFSLISELYGNHGNDREIDQDTTLHGHLPPSDVRETNIEKDDSPMARIIKQNLASFRVYHFHDTSKTGPLNETARLSDTRFLRPDGANLYRLQQQHKQAFNRIEATIRMIAPYFERFDLQPNGDYIRLNWRQKGTDMYLDAADLSDGTIRFIALCTLLIQPNLPQTILIDEPELGLHPYAITLLAGLMRSISLTAQLIVSTQSVELVNQFSPEDIIVVEHRNNESLFKRYTEAELADWLTEYSLGDIWQKNVIGGNP